MSQPDEQMKETKPNDPAFDWYDPETGKLQPNLTKRQQFAAMAMQGLAAASYISDPDEPEAEHAQRRKLIAEQSVKLADDLIKALNDEVIALGGDKELQAENKKLRELVDVLMKKLEAPPGADKGAASV